MMPSQFLCEVIANDAVAGDIFLTRFSCPGIAAAAQPGQFVNIRTADSFFPLLRRPFSICRRDPDKGWFEILYRVVGPGTRHLAALRPGAQRSVIGPLGNGFRWTSQMETAIVVAGGLGVAPMPFLAEVLTRTARQLQVFLGAKNKSELWGTDIFAKFATEVVISTDDGSAGAHGFVTTALERFVDTLSPLSTVQIFSCGPEPMLARMLAIGRERRIATQISVETMMGCGFGICMGCPMPTAYKGTAPAYKLSCIDGPVFDVEEVDIAW